ncbi:uncharacterized protein Tco025E_03578 [Trypanosoma conorhini]|uniref:Uncharacterized protein n=1 Tax=Trypanosoma conorhini TaxID=83891 RepID=A0A3R7LU98_9TRYP|nr:uncharacterized protein Tco025E_03578 [Trypanosoma conorhini]RNF20848.1 hypothetical protein Tco025E_03578 [Trypanosoma conorhini]
MSHYNTGIENIPSLFDLASALTGFIADFAQVVLGSTQTSFKAAALEDDDLGKYDPAARSWEGTGGLHYRVPLYPIPSERHTRDKTRNIRVLMDNCRHLCVEDELPSTKEEMQFWTAYRFMKYQMYLAPTCIIMPPLYIFLAHVSRAHSSPNARSDDSNCAFACLGGAVGRGNVPGASALVHGVESEDPDGRCRPRGVVAPATD